MGFMRCRYSLASGGFGLLVSSYRLVICSAKLLSLTMQYIHVNKLISLYISKFITLLKI